MGRVGLDFLVTDARAAGGRVYNPGFEQLVHPLVGD